MMTKLELFQNAITKIRTDVIVNAANTSLLGGGGVDGAIHRAAGPRLLEECRGLNGCKVGEAKITKGYELTARYVIHTVGPIWYGGAAKEEEMLASCYRNSLELAKKYSLRNIAFPSISTGAYNFPISKAVSIALGTTKLFIERNPEVFDNITFILFSVEDLQIYKEAYRKIFGRED